jgi:sigma-54 dependent transcriptional regulator, flagellar regulatory protein
MKRDTSILIIDDQSTRRQQMQVILDFLGENSLCIDSVDWKNDAEKVLNLDNNDLVVFIGECKIPSKDIISQLHKWNERAPIICIDSLIDTDKLDEDIRNCVIGNLSFPPAYSKFLDTLHRAQVYIEQHDLSRRPGASREAKLFRSLVGSSRQIHKVREMMAQVADKDVSVIILGESGTGKEVVARNLHYHSNRRDEAFIPVNCGAIPAELLESELFGHEKGAFTGAISSRAGRFEMAQGGTLFLDEIGDMPLNMQVKLLRVLQEHTYERVGGTKTYKSDVRILAATHRNLEEMIKEGTFREDLYYRLNVFPIDVPSLRERAEDIPLLLNELINRMENEKRGSIRFNSAAIMSLASHPWSGNVREMANLVERLSIMYPYGVIGVNELPSRYRHVDDQDEQEFLDNLHSSMQFSAAEQVAEVTQVVASNAKAEALLPVNGINLKEYLTDLEKSLIRQALEDCNNVVARSAEKLQIRRTTLVEKMRKYEISAKESA